MQAADILLNFSQIGLVVIGLISILYLFLEKTGLSKPDKQAIKFILFHSIALVFFSLLPFPIYYSSKFNIFTWKISSLIFAAYLLWSGLSTIIRVYQIKPSKPLVIWIGHIGPSFFSAIILIIFYGSIAVYLSALIWLLFTSIAQFVIAFLVHIKPDKNLKKTIDN